MVPFARFDGSGFRPGLIGIVGTGHVKDKAAPAGLEGGNVPAVFIGKAGNKDEGVALKLGLFIQLDPAAEGQLIGQGIAEDIGLLHGNGCAALRRKGQGATLRPVGAIGQQHVGNGSVQTQIAHVLHAVAVHRHLADHGVFVHAVIEFGVDAAVVDLATVRDHALFRIVLGQEAVAGLIAVDAAVAGGPEDPAAHGREAVGSGVIPPAQHRG